MTRRYFTIAALSWAALAIIGCGDDNESPVDTGKKLDPSKRDDDDRLFDEPSKPAQPSDYEADIELLPGESWTDASEEFGNNAFSNYSAGGQYKTYGTRNGGRQAWRIPKVGRVGSRALVVFASGARFTVILGKANRTKSSGFVFKKGSHGGYYIHARYNDRSQTVKVYWG